MVQEATSTGNEADIHCRLQKERWKSSCLGRAVYRRTLNGSDPSGGKPPFPTCRRRGSKGFFGSGADLGKKQLPVLRCVKLFAKRE